MTAKNKSREIKILKSLKFIDKFKKFLRVLNSTKVEKTQYG